MKKGNFWTILIIAIVLGVIGFVLIFTIFMGILIFGDSGENDNISENIENKKIEKTIESEIKETEKETKKPTAKPTKKPTPKKYTFSSGNYIAGKDFKAGMYDIKAISGNGNVSSDNMYSGGINAIMGVSNDEMYEKEYKNIDLPDGVKLSIINGVKIELIEVK